jgi:hypothetical protein
MPLTIGSRLGPFEIVSALGAGGMGEVYRARDSKLQRDVAIKVLTSTLAGDPDALARFEREAQSVAQLSHPNILAIHDFGHDGPVAYAVTELLEGETLRARLEDGPLPPRKAIEYALQIARGLAAAHDKGIVHRDLKPDNMFITRDDRVKILDFGLAKPAELPSGGATMTVGAPTASGTVLGTFGYMAPEQVRAQPLDHRADIFAFGALLYEMLTGRRAFPGDTPADTISAILHAEPPELALTVDGLPPALDRIVGRALDKKPELRFQSAHDLAFALETLANAPTSGARTPSGTEMAAYSRPPRSRVVPLLPWALAAGALAFSAWTMTRPQPAAGVAPLTRLELSLPAGIELHVFGGSMAISPDGRMVGFVGVRGGIRQAYVRYLDQAEAAPIKGTETAFRMFFSPAGDRLGVVLSDGTIRLVTLGSGLVTPLAERTDFFGSTWTASDQIVFTRDRKLWRIPAAGGVATAVVTPKDDSQMAYPHALPNSDDVVVGVSTPAGSDIALVSLTTGEQRILVRDGELPVYSATGHLLFLRAGSLTAVRFDIAKGEIVGDQVPVMEGLPTSGRAAAVSVSASGTLVYVGTQALQSQLVWVNREGAERPLTKASRQYANPRVSPDGRRVLVQTLSGELWIYDGQRETLSRLATPIPMVGFPLWMPDGREIIFKTSEGMHRLEVDGGRHSHLAGSVPNDYPAAISADGKTLAATRLSGATSGDVYILSLTGAHEPRAWLATPAYDGGARWSPDGRMLVYSSTESGQQEIYLQPYPGPGVRRQVSIDGGSHPVWNRDGREVFYRQNSRMYTVSVTRSGADVVLSQPRLLFDRLYGFGQGISIPNYDVSSDGKEFAFVKDAGATHLNVILNWATELNARTGQHSRR